MATLTWQDVAGQVRAPDYSDAAALITQGIQGLGKSVADLGSAPEQRRQAALAKEMMLVDMQAKGVQQRADLGIQLGKELDVRTEKKDMKEFSKNQSFLEAGARKAAMAGMKLEDYLANDKTFQGMSDGAKAYSASHLSDAYLRGDETRITMEERAKDDAYRAQRDAVQDRQWAANYRLSAENARLAREERAQAKAAADALKPKVWKTGNDKTDRAMTMLANKTGTQFIEASGAAYADQTIGDVGKGFKNLGAASSLFQQENERRMKAGKPPLPENVLKRVLDYNIGNNTFFDGANNIDDAAFNQLLTAAGDQYDTALKGREFYEYLSGHVDRGARPDQAAIDRGFNMMFPAKPKPVSVKPTTARRPLDFSMVRPGRD